MSIYIGGSTISDIYVGGSTSRLPSTYQEVEYIQNSGTQYINTGVYPNPDYTTEVKFQNVSFSTYNSFFGCRNGSNSRYYARNDIYDTVWVNRSYSTNSGYEKYTASSPKDYNVHTFKLSRYLYIDGTLVKTFSAMQSSTAFPYSIYLFCINSEGTSSDFMMGKIFYCKIWNASGTLIRDMVPCYRKSDNVIGMYDLVNNTFYTNAGSGTFTKGADVGGRGNVSAVYVGTTKVRPSEKVQTFDFQNEGSLNWTAQSVRGTPTLTSGQGWTIGSASDGDYQSAIMPPSSVYDGNILKKYKIWVYKGVNAHIIGNTTSYTVGCGPSNASCSQFAIWENTYRTYTIPSIATVNDGTAHNIVTSGKTGELILEYIFNDDGSLILSVDGTEYNLGNYATMFRSLWTNQNLGLTIGRWDTSNGQIYVRKVEITTE